MAFTLIHRLSMILLVIALVSGPVAQAIQSSMANQPISLTVIDMEVNMERCDQCGQHELGCDSHLQNPCTWHASCSTLSCFSFVAITAHPLFADPLLRRTSLLTTPAHFSSRIPGIEPRPPKA